MIHGESIACPAVLTGTWPAGTGCEAWDRLSARQSRSTNGGEPRESSKVTCLPFPANSDLFTSPCVCVSEKMIGMAMIIILIMPSAHTLAKVQLSISDWITQGWLDFSALHQRQKHSCLCSPPSCFRVHPSHHSSVLFFFFSSSQIISISLCLLCIDFSCFSLSFAPLGFVQLRDSH